jgi:hypothetical protein
LCGADVISVEDDETRRRNANRRVKNYEGLPRCRKCEDATRRGDNLREVTVCAACLQASCWQGEFYCETAKTAGTTRRTVGTLRQLGREDPSYWGAERIARIEGTPT